MDYALTVGKDERGGRPPHLKELDMNLFILLSERYEGNSRQVCRRDTKISPLQTRPDGDATPCLSTGLRQSR